MRDVLSYINEDPHDALYAPQTFQRLTPTFDIFLRTYSENLLLLDYGKQGLIDVVKKFYIDVVKPNMVETKFTNLQPEALFCWVQLAKKFTPSGEDCEKLEVVRDTLAEWSKKELKIIHKCFASYPKFSKWVTEQASSRSLDFGAESLISIAEAQEFTALVQELGTDQLDRRLIRLNDAFCFDEDTDWNERLDHLYNEAYESRWRKRTCAECSAEVWDSQTYCFKRFHDKCGCAMSSKSRCATCIINNLQGEHENEERAPPSLALKRQTCFGCPKGKCILLLHTLQGDAASVIAKHNGVTPAQVEKQQAEDFEKIVMSVLREMPAKALAEPKRERHWKSSLNKFSNIDPDSVKALGPAKKKEYKTLHTEIENILKMHRVKKEFSSLEDGINDVMSNIFEDPDKMFNSCNTLVGPIQRILYNRPTGMDKIPEMFDMSPETIVNIKLQRAKDVLSVAYRRAKQCAICMSVVKPTDTEEILQLHSEMDSDVSQWHYDQHGYRNGRKQFRLPCFACKDCFSNYLNYKKALGKPAMKCPGMNCGCALRKTHVKKICPLAYEDHQIAMKRFALKRVKNFRTCPNADCAASIVIDIDCSVAKVTCASCNFEFCPNCNDSPHEGISCEEMRRRRHAERWGDSKDYMENETKQCPFCLTWIEKNGGCNHMTCHHCRGEFCWLCFGDWSTHKSCTNVEPVVRRPFNELFPDWTEKPKKTIKPKFHPGKYVLFQAEGKNNLGRVQAVKEFGLYAIKPVHNSFFGIKVVEESLLRGYNKFVYHKDDLANQEAAYTRFLSGFSDAEMSLDNADLSDSGDDSADPADTNVSVELTLKEAPAVCLDKFLTSETPTNGLFDGCDVADVLYDEACAYFVESSYTSFLSGFDSDTDDEDEQKLPAKAAQIRLYGTEAWLENKEIQTFKEMKRVRASREKNREQVRTKKAEVTDFELPSHFFYDSDDSDSWDAPQGLFPDLDSDSDSESSS